MLVLFLIKVKKFGKMKKRIEILIQMIIPTFIVLSCIGQSKIVYIESEDLYVTIFFKKNNPKYIKNDSVFYICSPVNDSIFYLKKYVHKSNVFIQKYEIGSLSHELLVNTKIWNRRKNKNEIIKSKIKYYLGKKLS